MFRADGARARPHRPRRTWRSIDARQPPRALPAAQSPRRRGGVRPGVHGDAHRRCACKPCLAGAWDV